MEPEVGELRAQRSGRGYEIMLDARPVARFERERWRSGGRITLDGVELVLRAEGWGRRYTVTAADGEVVAQADRRDRRRWDLRVDDVGYRLERTSAMSLDQTVRRGDEPVGTISRSAGGVRASLPDLSPRAQVVAACLVLGERARRSRRLSG